MALYPATPLPCQAVPPSRVFAEHPWAEDDNGAVTWLFAPGMLFGNLAKWWGAGGDRQQSHEGVDFRCFVTSAKKDSLVGPHTTVPVLYDGELVRCLDDFLGASLFVRHAQYRWEDLVLYTVYGHVAPDPGITNGTRVAAGKVIARVAAGRGNASKVPPHLHLSMVLVPESVNATDLDWPRLTQPDIVLCDPLAHLAIDYRIGENIC